MPSSLRVRNRDLVAAPLAVVGIEATLLAAGYLVTVAFQVPQRLGLPLPVRLFGLFILVLVGFFFRWFFQYRKPRDVVVSTYVSLLKAASGVGLEKRHGRTEPLVVEGPYRFVRHPLYFGVLAALLGFWMLLDRTFLLASWPFFFAWFNFVIGPYEERELHAMFGRDYEKYARKVPRIMPIPRYRWVRSR